MENLKKSINNKKIAVIGAGLSGIAASNLAYYLGAKVILIDSNKNFNNKNIPKNIKIYLGDFPKEILDCELVVISPGINCSKNKSIKEIESKNIPIISEIEFASWFTKGKVIGITGSNGKSTVVSLLGEITKSKFSNAFIGGNIGIPFSKNVLHELKKNKNNVIHILEISSYQLERIFFFKPDISCILNISKDHLNRYNSFKEYYETKFKIFNKNKLFFNKDDKILNQNFSTKKHAIGFSIKSDNIYKIEDGKLIDRTNNQSIIISKINLRGNHNLENIIAVLNMSRELNININNSKNIIYNFKPLKHRMEVINTKPLIINDSKSTNLNSTKVAIQSFKDDIVLILGGYSNEKLDKKELIKTVNKIKIKNIICYGQIGKKINLEIKKYKKCIYIKDFKEAVNHCITQLNNKQTLLFSPGFKSFDQFTNFEERGIEFTKQIKKYNI